MLIVGFALHNATEGFGIVGPLGDVRPSWRWLAVAGVIGGGPTFVGSIVGYEVTSHALELAFYAIAGGAILYVIGEVWNGMRRFGYRELELFMVTAGFMVGVLTDLVVAYGGGDSAAGRLPVQTLRANGPPTGSDAPSERARPASAVSSRQS